MSLTSFWVDAEYLRNADKISWVKSFKDVYQKYVASYQRVAATSLTCTDMFDDLDMPCFYLRNQASIALFKIDENGVPLAELIPSINMVKAIKESKSFFSPLTPSAYRAQPHVHGAKHLRRGRLAGVRANFWQKHR